MILFDISSPAQTIPEGITFIYGDIASYGTAGQEQLNRNLIEEVIVGGTDNILQTYRRKGGQDWFTLALPMSSLEVKLSEMEMNLCLINLFVSIMITTFRPNLLQRRRCWRPVAFLENLCFEASWHLWA